MVAVKTILLVEDDQVASTTYESRLEREGFHVETAPDGLAALKMLSKLTVDLVILDLILPKLDGANVLKRMRGTPNLQNVPVIVLSNAASPELGEDAMLTGPTRRLHKTDCPFPLLMQTMQELFAIAPPTSQAQPAAAGGTAPVSGNGQPKPGGNAAVPNGQPPERSEFLKAVIQKIPEIREHCCAYIRAPGSAVGTQHLVELHQRADWVRTSAESLHCTRIAMFAHAFEALLAEIKAKPSVITPSILQTIAQAVDCLALLLKSDEVALAKPMPHTRVLVVDDDAVCCMASVKSLKRANFDVESISDPLAALEKLQSMAVDAVLLDINMPGITGFELCEKLRHLPGCKTVPVIFITGYSNFDNRKQSVLSGGQDFITKPIFPLELALKTTLHVLKAQVQHPILRTVTPEPGKTGIYKPSLPEAAKPEPAAFTTRDRAAKNETAPIPIPDRLRIQLDAPAAFPPATTVATASASANLSPPGLPVSRTPELAATRSEGLRLREEPGKETTPAPSAGTTPEAEKPARSSRGEAETVGLDDERSQLRMKLAAEQQAAAKLRQDLAAVQRKLNENATEQAKVEKAWAELQHKTVGLTETAATAEQTRNALREKENLCTRLEQELAGFRTGRDDLQAKLAAAEKMATSVREDFEALRKQAHYDAAVLAKTRTDLQEQSASFNTASAAAEDARKALKEKEAHCTQLEQTVTSLQAAQSELQARLAAEQQSVAQLQEQTRALQQQSQESTAALAQARADFQQASEKLGALTAEAEQSQKLLQETETRCKQLDADLAGAVAGRTELEKKFADEQRASADLLQEFETLQQQSQETTAALDQTRADLQQASEKLGALTAEADQTPKLLRETETRCSQLAQDLAGAVAGRSELEKKLADEQQAFAGLRQEFEALQKQHQDSIAALDQARADLQQAPEKLRAETAEADQTRKLLHETESRCKQLETDLAGAVAGRAELEKKLADEQQASAGLLQEFETLQKQHQDSVTALNQAGADLQQQSAERTRLESELHRQQESTTASTNQTQAVLSEQEARCGQLTQELTSLWQEHRELQARLAAEQETAAKSQHDSAGLQQQLNETMAALERTRTELQQQKTERARQETERRNLEATNENLNRELTRLREPVQAVKAPPVPEAPTETPGQSFQLTAPDAGMVLLVGDFTGWEKEPVPMQPGANGVWSATVKLLPGTYQYMFIVDGQWREDPACPQRVPSGFGGQNMVRQVA